MELVGKEVIKAWSPPAKCMELGVELWNTADELNNNEPAAMKAVWESIRSQNYQHRGSGLSSPGILFMVESMPSYAGLSDSILGTISISQNIDPRAIADTFRHELAHIVTNAKNGVGRVASHGKEWKKWARVLGAKPIATNPIWSWTGRSRSFGDVELELPKTTTLVGDPVILIAYPGGHLRVVSTARGDAEERAARARRQRRG